MSEIKSDKLFLKDVFQKWYSIPEYQRPYVWEDDQVTELLEDISQARKSNAESQYFLGSMVLKKSTNRESGEEYEEFDLLDGQQRLITLLLITAVVRDLTPQSNESRVKTCKDTIYQIANPDDRIPERSRVIFAIREEVQSFMNEYVKADLGTERTEELKRISEKSGEDISKKNMAKAILTIRAFFENGNSIDDFFPFFRSNVLMIYVSAEELEDAFHLFTVMNNRGIKLRNSDILKADNLAKIQDDKARNIYAKKWEDIEEYFGEDFDNFLSHIRTILVKQKAGYNLLKEYENNIYAPKDFDRNSQIYTNKPPLLNKGEDTLNFVESYYEHYLDLFEKENYELTNSYEFYNKVKLMRAGLKADYWVAPLLRYYDKHGQQELVKFLNYLDAKVSSDLVIGLSPTTRIEHINAIIRRVESETSPRDIFTSSEFAIDFDELTRILKGRIYGRPFARYILLKLALTYQGHTMKFAPYKTITIEHILPQMPSQDSQWCLDFGEEDRETWTDRLGNLILLSRSKNTTLSNLDYGEKKEKYFKNNVELFSNSVTIFSTFNTWRLNDLQQNHNKMLERLLGSYKISNE